MNSANLRQALTQTLENFQRCGVVRFGKSEKIPPEMLAALEQFTASNSGVNDAPGASSAVGASMPSQGSAAPGVPDGAVASSSPAVAPVEPQAPVPAPTQAPSPTPVSVPTGPATGPWTLPVLELQQRQAEFSGLDERVRACRRCPNIVDFRQQTVFGVGNLKPRLCFIGEAPGADEDRKGEPFVGRAGQLLDKIIAAMKLQREEVYILNALKCRPPQNRTPLPEEIANCNEFVERQLEVLQPEYIVCLGAVAVRALLGSSSPIGRLRGRFHQYKAARVVVTYHPSYLLRQESAKRLVWDDMKMLLNDMGISI